MFLRLALVIGLLGCSSTSSTRDAAVSMDSGTDATTGGQGGVPALDAADDATLDSTTPDGGSGGSGGAGAAPADAARDAAEEQDAGAMKHRCFVEGCNGDFDSIPSSQGCPSQPPRPGASCNLADGAECFYCDEDERFLSIAQPYPSYRCDSGTWVFEELVTACD